MTSRRLVEGRGVAIRTRWREPLYRSGYSLILSSLLTGGLGFLYWVIAARAYSPADVGRCAALIAAMTLIGDLAHLNLKGALNRFLPSAGDRSARLTARAYGISVLVAALVGGVFVAGIDIWSPELRILHDTPWAGVLFVLGAMAWTIFVLEDAALTGIRQAVWVPAENLIFSIAKVGLLAGLAAALPTLGILVSWAVPTLLLIIPVNILLFRRLIPAHARAGGSRSEPARGREIARYAAADYLAYLLWTATAGILPLVVLHVLGPEANAHYYFAYTVTYSLYLLSSSMGNSLMTEASRDMDRLWPLCRQAVAESARLVVPAVALVVLGAPVLLNLVGEEYAKQGSGTLRILALSALPFMVTTAFSRVRSIQQRMRPVVLVEVVLCALLVGFAWLLITPYGTTGVAWAWLIAQTTVAIGIVLHLAWGELRRSGARGPVGVASFVLTALRNHRARPEADRMVDVALRLAGRRSRDVRGWVIHRHLVTINDVTVTVVGPPGGPPSAIVKRARSARQDESIQRAARVQRLLSRDEGLVGWAGRTLPKVLSSGTAGGRAYVIESLVPGTSLEGLPPGDALRIAADVVSTLHGRTASRVRLDQRRLERWIDRPLEVLRQATDARSREIRAHDALARIAAELREGLLRKDVSVSWVHGDLTLGNVLADDGSTHLVDWELARSGDLPQLDIVHLILTTRAASERRELGDVVADWLADPTWTANEAPLVARMEEWGSEVDMRVLVLLAWLRHTSANLQKSLRYGESRVWLPRNVDPVLRAFLARPVVASPAPTDTEVDERTGAASRAVRLIGLGALGVTIPLWLFAIRGIDPLDMTNLGLLSVLPVWFFVALGLLTLSFAVCAHQRRRGPVVLTAHLVLLVAMLHATPSIIYGTLRYAWAWKHLGIVDYIHRNGAVRPDIAALDVYHNWPGFFAVSSFLQELTGWKDMSLLASWTPFVFTLLSVLGVVFVTSALTNDRRVVWLSAWTFVVTNWIGQEYFSPQGFSFILYLFTIGIVLRWFRPAGIGVMRFLPRRIRRGFARRVAVDEGERLSNRQRGGLVVILVILMVAITASHALSSMVLAVSLTGLLITGCCSSRAIPLAAVATVALWAVTGARDYVGTNVKATLGSIAAPWTTTESNLVSTVKLSAEQAFVAYGARVLTLAVLVFALLGAIRLHGRGALDPAPVVLALTPALLFLTGDYDGELIFRIYLFAVPMLAFFIAHLFLGESGSPEGSPIAAWSVLASLLLGGLLVAYYGRERQNYFTRGEVAAAKTLYGSAPPGSILIQATRNVPVQFANYENFTYLTIRDEEPSTRKRLLLRPAKVLAEWMAEPKYRTGYVFLTRSQKAEVEGLGSLPQGSVERIERALSASPRFQVVRDRDTFTATLRRGPIGCADIPLTAAAEWYDGSVLGFTCPPPGAGARGVSP